MKRVLFCPMLLSFFLISCVAFKDQMKDENCRKSEQSLQSFFKWRDGKKSPVIMAHRMAPKSGYADNGFKTLEYTYHAAPCVIQEMDVRMSKDSVLFMLHDPTLDRTTTGHGNLSDFTVEEIGEYELKDINGRLLKGQHIPKLTEVLNFVKKNKMIVALDMKPGTDPKKLMKIVRQTRTLNQIFVICYHLKDAIILHKLYPSLMMALGFNSWEDIAAIEKSGLPFQNLIALTPSKLQEKQFYDKIHGMGIMVSFSAQGGVDVYPNNTTRAYLNVFNLGGDIICTDSLKNVQHAFN